MCICVYVYIYMCVCVYIYTRMCIYTRRCIRMCVYIHMCIYVYRCTHTYLHTYTCTRYVRMHIHIHIYTYVGLVFRRLAPGSGPGGARVKVAGTRLPQILPFLHDFCDFDWFSKKSGDFAPFLEFLDRF